MPFKKYVEGTILDFDKRKNIKFKCRSCKREWICHNFTDKTCIYCNSNKIMELK